MVLLLLIISLSVNIIHVVAITFTALILTELLLVVLTIRTWHGLMITAEIINNAIYILSLVLLKYYFGKNIST